MSTIVVVDPGSTHLKRRDLAEKLIDTAKKAKASCIKFQLFKGEEYTDDGNIELPLDMFKDLYNYGKSIGIPVTASCFNLQAFELLMSLEVHHIKIAYSKRKRLDWIRGALSIGKRVVVTTNLHDSYDLPEHENLIKLVTQPRCKHADEYSVLTKMNFDGLFTHGDKKGQFQGFSDHSLGYLEAQSAVQHGAIWVEKHLRLNDSICSEVPDGRFALNPQQMEEFVWQVR